MKPHKSGKLLHANFINFVQRVSISRRIAFLSDEIRFLFAARQLFHANEYARSLTKKKDSIKV